MTFEERLAAVEKSVAANAIPPTMAALMRKLEALWQPDAAVLLEPGSITPELLAGTVDSDGKGFTLGASRVRWGTASATWTASIVSGDVVIPHGLGLVPVVVTTTGRNTGVEYTCAARDASNITVRGYVTANIATTATVTFDWIAIA